MSVRAAAELELVRHEVLADIERWLPEVGPDVRSTLWHGVFMKAAKQTDRLFQLCVDVAIHLAGPAAPEAVAIVSRGKPSERLTMGERMDVLKTLDRQRAIAVERKIIGKTDRQLLEDLTILRNNFAHGSIPSGEGPEQTQRFLELARQFCETQLVQTLAKAHV